MSDRRISQINEELLELIDELEEAAEDKPDLADKINAVIDRLTDASEALDEIEEQ